MAKKKNNNDLSEGMDAKDILKSHLDNTAENHFNYDDPILMPKVSSGSLLVDFQLNGGFEPSIIRPVGNTQSGKTASTLEHVRNFLNDTSEPRKALYIKSEGRLSLAKQQLSGVKFVTQPEDWEDGTCFLLKTNIYEDVVNLLRLLINKKSNNPYTRYWFVFDSMDGLIGKEDFKKKADEAVKVAGGALITSTFLKAFSLYMHEQGHYASMIGQMRSSGPQNQYAEKSQKVGSASGGNAIQHYSDWIFEYYPPNKFVFEDYSVDTKGKDDKKNKKIIGHYARFTIKKGDKEECGAMVEYPILYNQIGGNAVCRELEIIDIAVLLQILNKKGAWYSFDSSLISNIKDHNIEMPEQFQGSKNVVNYLKENKSACDIIEKYIRNIITSMG